MERSIDCPLPSSSSQSTGGAPARSQQAGSEMAARHQLLPPNRNIIANEQTSDDTNAMDIDSTAEKTSEDAMEISGSSQGTGAAPPPSQPAGISDHMETEENSPPAGLCTTDFPPLNDGDDRLVKRMKMDNSSNVSKGNDQGEYFMGDLLSFSYSEMLKANFPEMFNVNAMSRVNVEVNLLRGKGWTGQEKIHGKIVALVSDEQRHSAHFRVGSVLFNRTSNDPLKGEALKGPLEGSNSSPVEVPLDRPVVAVPSGWVLHIKVDLHVTIPHNTTGEKPKPLNATLTLDSKTTVQSQRPHGSGIKVTVTTTWWPWTTQEIGRQFYPQLSSPVEIQRAEVPRCDIIVYTIGDAMSFTEFIMTLRRMLTYHHPADSGSAGCHREDILDGHELLNLCSTREHPLLDKYGPQPRWHLVKLQVVDPGQNTPSSWITLVMRGDNLYVLAFINQQGVQFDLLDENEKGKSVVIHSNEEKVKECRWGLTYPKLLAVEGKDEEGTSRGIVEKLTDGKLGEEFAKKAVRVLSCYQGDNGRPERHGLLELEPRVALAGLIVMVCESARMNPIHDSIAAGWSNNGKTLTEKMVREYVWEWKDMSDKLQKWRKDDGCDQTHPISELQAVYLVLHSKGQCSSKDRSIKNPGNQTGRSGDTDAQGQHQASGSGSSGPKKHQASGSGSSDPSQNQASGGSGSSGPSRHQASGSGSSGPSQPPQDNNQSKEVGFIQVRGRPRVELLAIHANLTVGTTIIAFDGKRGQLIYRKEKQGEQEVVEKGQGEQGGMPELVLTGPYTGISAYGFFEIQINIPDHPGGPIKWEWDCEQDRYTGQVDDLQSSKYTISTQDKSEIAKITYAVMSNAREATVQVKLRRLKDGQTPTVVSANIRALIDGFNDKSLLLHGKGMVHPLSPHDPWCRLELARNVVAVPCGKALHIEIEIEVDQQSEAGGVNNKNKIKVPDLRFDNGICSKRTDDDTVVEVEVTWYPEVEMTSGRQPDVDYTIGDAQSFKEFIKNLRHCLANHRDSEEILGCRMLAKRCAEQPARWLHVRLQAVMSEETSWTTLIMRDDDLYVHGFMNQQGICYELLETKDRSVNMLPENKYNSPRPLFWGLKYRTILDVKDDSEAAAKLEFEGLGKDFAIKAVRRLSSSFRPDDEQVFGIMKSARLALAGLIVMVCESARFNPVRKALADGWSSGTGFTKELTDCYVQRHEEISWELQAWKSRRFRRPPEIISELQDTYLVLDTRVPKVKDGNVLISYAEWLGRKDRLELLSVRANLEVVGTKIIIFDGKRGQIIYRQEKQQREPGRMVDLVLTGPYADISPYGCFAIKIDIPNDDSIKWKRTPESEIKINKLETQSVGKIAEVTYAVMSKNTLGATVQVKLRLNDGHSPSGVSGVISTPIDGVKYKDWPSILFRRAKGSGGQCFSSTDDSMFLLQLDSNAVAVPRGEVLIINVDLEIETSNNQEIKNLKADLKIANGSLSQCHVVDGGEIEVNLTWHPEVDIRDTRLLDSKEEKVGPQHEREVVYTIGDDKSYDGFIMALRRILTDYPNRDDIQGHPLLSQQWMWLSIKLQVAGEEVWTTLFIQYHDLCVHSFRNKNGGWFVDRSLKKWVEAGPWSRLDAQMDGDEVVNTRLDSTILGKSSAARAVRVLSDFEGCVFVKEDRLGPIWEALATLKVMVCDSAKINPVHDAIIKQGWIDEGRLTKELIDYIKNWEPISRALLQWKDKEYPKEDEGLKRLGFERPDEALNVIHLCCPFTLFGSPTRDYLISNKGDKVPISDLEGKYVGVCSVVNGYPPLNEFTAVLAKIYDKLKQVGEKFEVVAVPLDNNESSFNESFAKMPWLAIPPGDQMCEKLNRCFKLRSPLPTLVLIRPDGKTLHNNIAYVIQYHGFAAWEGFPFTYEKLEILAEKKAKAEAAWQSLMVRSDLDFVIGKEGAMVPVSKLVGKTVLLYFSAQWCPGSGHFLPLLMREYNKIKEKNSDFEVVFISNDRDRSSFEEHFFLMPWLALPFGDERNTFLTETFRIHEIPSLVAIGPTGKIVSNDAIYQLMIYGADAFPFTEERLKELQKKLDEMAKGWPQKRDDSGFDLHPKCALGDEEKKAEEGETS